MMFGLDPKHLAILDQGVSAWNNWRAGIETNMTFYTHLSGANLSGRKLAGINFSFTGLADADLSGADLLNADLRSAGLFGAHLREAELVGANLNKAEVEGTDFDLCRVGLTTFGDIDLRKAKGLETIRHLGPSTIG